MLHPVGFHRARRLEEAVAGFNLIPVSWMAVLNYLIKKYIYKTSMQR